VQQYQVQERSEIQNVKGAAIRDAAASPALGSRLLTVEDVAAQLGVSEAWVYQHSCGARRPTLPSVKLGRAVRFRPESVDEFIHQMERGV
jgi:excisionase family DNA binding protein